MLRRHHREGHEIATAAVGEFQQIPAHALEPNDWNPNVMTEAERAQLRLEIQRFGFVVPLVVRPVGDHEYQIIDGENRYREGRDIGMTLFPSYIVDVDEDTAKQLTPILNELHGTPAEDKLGELLKDLLTRKDEQEIRSVMPFSRERFDALIGEKTVDWSALERPQPPMGQTGDVERWVERVYRMPADAAEVVDQAVAKAREEANAGSDWQGLEFIAAEFMGR